MKANKASKLAYIATFNKLSMTMYIIHTTIPQSANYTMW